MSSAADPLAATGSMTVAIARELSRLGANTPRDRSALASAILARPVADTATLPRGQAGRLIGILRPAQNRAELEEMIRNRDRAPWLPSG